MGLEATRVIWPRYVDGRADCHTRSQDAMFDVTARGAQYAVCNMSDMLSSVTDLNEPTRPMPSPNVASKNATRKTPDKGQTEVHAKLVRRKSQDLASKIAGWDAGGAAQQQDEVVVIEEHDAKSGKDGGIVEVMVDAVDSDIGEKAMDRQEVTEGTTPTSPTDGRKTPGTGTAKPGTKVAKSSHTSRQVDLDRKAFVRRKSKPHAEISAELKQATTPKKRVVSDGHWRRDKLPKNDTPTPEKAKEKEATPKPVTIRRSVVSVGLKVPPSVQDFVEEQQVPAKVRPIRASRSRSRSRSLVREATPDYEDSGVKVYIKARKRSRTFNDRKNAAASESSFTAGTGSSFEKPSSSLTDITTPSHSPPKEQPSRPATAPRERPSRRSLDRANEARLVSGRKFREVQPENMEKAKAKPKTAQDPPSPAPVPRFGNRIEGWLAATSDPFVESDPSLTPEPLTVPKRKSTNKLDEDLQEASSDDRRKSSARRRRSKPSLEPVDTQQDDTSDASPSATPTLKRSTARRHTHSPVKDRLVRDSRSPSEENAPPRTVSEATLSKKVSREHARPFLGNGHRLSTIASADTLSSRRHDAMSDVSDHPTVIPQGSVLSRVSDGDQPTRRTSGLKRRLTKHSDLMSVLSMSRDERIKPARSVRTRRLSTTATTVADFMNELTTDELKYQRELRTLVDGVIPVLLTYVLQKTDATGAKRLFSGSSPAGQAVTRPIVEMGVALEKLRATHKRIPLHNADELFRWAENAAKHYAEYLKAWRLGFQDVIVTLAPAEAGEPSSSTQTSSGEGEKVDVAYLLKRPLVRLKYLTKTFKAIDQAQASDKAKTLGDRYYELVQDARQRNNDERARLEDEAAANIDPTRARDPRSLAPLAGVSIDPTRSVRARDYFDMDLTHSSGQQLRCRIEMILRDDAPDRGTSSDILFCEVSIAGRWLLFPPMQASHVSARPGDKDGEIVVMVRGMLAGAKEWREIMLLKSDDDGAVSEWLDMLSAKPVPPKLMKTSSFNELRGAHTSGELRDAPSVYRPPSPSEVDVPLGERASSAAQQWDGSEVNSTIGDIPPPTLRRARAKRYRSTPPSPAPTEDSYERVHSRANRIAEQERYSADESSIYDRPWHNQQRPKSSYTSSRSDWNAPGSAVSTPKKDYSVWMPSSQPCSDDSDSADSEERPVRQLSRPGMHRRTSSVPSMDMPTIPKLRKRSEPDARQLAERIDSPIEPPEPRSAPSKLLKRRTPSKEDPKKAGTTPAPIKTSSGLRSHFPSFTPAFLKRNRRPSSPLKHEYEPSTATESLSDSDLSDFSDDRSVTSESSADEDPEDPAISTIGDLKDFRNPETFRLRAAPKSIPSLAGDSVGPSDSASQGPYRHVPPPSTQPARTVATVSGWTDKGAWEQLHPQECCIIVTPGLIEAFDLTQASTAMAASDVGDAVTPSQKSVRPIVGLELTPLVPLRRGTALDISIRSPPTESSLVKISNQIQFRSRSPEECGKLYNLINRARIDNPTYIALQNARGPVATSNWAEIMDKRNATRTSSSSSWLRLGSKKSSTYRSSGPRTVSVAATESSIGTMNTAFSALRRFSGSNRLFNIAKSTLTSREGTRSTYSDSLSSGAATPIPIDPSMGTPLGITNAKIRLYVRESMTKWRDMGSARLTVMLPPRQEPAGMAANPRKTGMEKRILVCGKSKGETLLDVTLGEQCFERVARTGIAISVWEEAVGPNGEGRVAATGGVASGNSKIYMVQMKSVSCAALLYPAVGVIANMIVQERDAAYTFGLVGKLRY
jgi:hypothetical protein